MMKDTAALRKQSPPAIDYVPNRFRKRVGKPSDSMFDHPYSGILQFDAFDDNS